MGAVGAGLLAILGVALSALGFALGLEAGASPAVVVGAFGSASSALPSAALVLGAALLALGLLFVRRGDPGGR